MSNQILPNKYSIPYCWGKCLVLKQRQNYRNLSVVDKRFKQKYNYLINNNISTIRFVFGEIEIIFEPKPQSEQQV